MPDLAPQPKIRYAVDSFGVCTITLDDPATRNALSTTLIEELIGALEVARDDRLVRSVVLRSSHERVFSSGGDLGGFSVGLVAKHVANERFVYLLRLVGELGKPSVCAASGHVLAGALANSTTSWTSRSPGRGTLVAGPESCRW